MLSPRFFIAEQHGRQQPKYRLIDDLTKSLVNSAAQTTETFPPQDLDSFVAQTRLQISHGSDHLAAWSLAFSHAYKAIALRPNSAVAAHIFLINHAGNRPYTARILVQPFGSMRAPANWGLAVTFIQFVARKLIYLDVGAFAGDVYCAENVRIVNAGFWAFKQLCRLVGFNTSDKKDHAPSGDISLLGAEVYLLCDAIRAQAITQRVRKIKGHIDHALQLNFLTRAAARKLRGRLGFYTSLLMGKLGRGVMGPLILRQYRPRTTKLTRALKMCLIWRYNALGSLPPRAKPFSLLPPVGAHSDAQGLGQISCRVLIDSVSTCHPHLHEWFVRMAEKAEGESSIYLFEICAAILTVFVVNERSLGGTHSCVLFIDSQAALAALVKGPTSSELGTAPVGFFWNFDARSPAQWWLEYVNAKSNHSDEPPRSCDARDVAFRTRYDGRTPEAFSTAFLSWETPHMASTRLRIDTISYLVFISTSPFP